MDRGAMESFYKVALTFVEGVGSKTARNLVEAFGSAEGVFDAKEADLDEYRITAPIKRGILNKSTFMRAEVEMEFADKRGIDIIAMGDPEYPAKLAEVADAPFLFYYKGKSVLHADRVMSIVGTRNASSYGKRICGEFVQELVPYDPVIVSGLAYGIDAFAHEAAVKHNIPTVAVLGHGLDMMYPEAHIGLAERMLERGGWLSEFPSGTIPDRFNFPMRNRIIAGLADVTVVVEAGAKGGALITANLAHSYHREVCAFPGGIYQDYSAGCNQLIMSNKAYPIHRAKNLEYIMNWKPVEGMFSPQHREQVAANGQEVAILDFLHQNGPTTMDQMCEGTGLNVHALSLILIQMEIKQLITPLPGRVYESR